MDPKKPTWATGTILYQIYLRSFKDSNGDGIGDLPGIISQLDYLQDLGVNALWLTPFYPSPKVDLGYDVMNYRDIDPLFGSLDDFKRLISEIRSRGMRLLVDLVPNHTSEQHPWFIESKFSKDSAKRDWYIWRDGKPDGGPPNNWQSVFGGSAWEYDEASGQYYLHSFLKQQPDLNWENQAVREAIKNVMRFWLDLGVDGFRVDAVSYISKDPELDDEPKRDGEDGLLALNIQFGPKLYKYMEELAGVLQKYNNKFMITEAYADDLGSDERYYEQFYTHVDARVAAPFNFEAIHHNWQAAEFAKFINEFQSALRKPYVPVYAFSNHDNPRLATRFGPDKAKAAAVLQLTLPGIPVIYYGDELGMVNGDAGNLNSDHPSSDLARYPARTPMQWANSNNAGFTDAETPWLPVNQNYHSFNVTVELTDPDSMINLYKRLTALRKNSPALLSGRYEPLALANNDVYGFRRIAGDQQMIILINFSSESQSVDESIAGQLVLSTHDRDELGKKLELQPNEGLIIAS